MRRAKLRGGIIGCGAMTETKHLPAWRMLKDVEIAAVCDQNKEIVEKTAKRWEVYASYADMQQMLEKEKLDFVDICTPPSTHFPLAKQAVMAKLNVLVEKPVALALSEADELCSAVKTNDVRFCVMHNSLYSPVIQRAISLVKDGVIGDILQVEIRWLDRSNRLLDKQDHWCHRLPGGIFGEYSPHLVYIASAFLNNVHPVKAVARKRSEYPWVTADELKVLIEADNGIGSLTISCNSPVTCLTIDIIGTKRCLLVNDFTQILTSTGCRSGKIIDRLLDRFDLIYPILTATTSGAVKRILGCKQQDAGHYSVIQKFAKSMRYDIAPPVTVEDGRETTKILEEIWKLM